MQQQHAQQHAGVCNSNTAIDIAIGTQYSYMTHGGNTATYTYTHTHTHTHTRYFVRTKYDDLGFFIVVVCMQALRLWIHGVGREVKQTPKPNTVRMRGETNTNTVCMTVLPLQSSVHNRPSPSIKCA